MAYARGKKAIGTCDRCGTIWRHSRLKFEMVNGVRTRMMVCPDCYDGPHPRDDEERYQQKAEAIAIRNPKPDPVEPQIHSIWGWGPVVGAEVPVEPAPVGWTMRQDGEVAHIYILWEDGSRILWEDGDIINWG